jgi:hypothetical protein
MLHNKLPTIKKTQDEIFPILKKYNKRMLLKEGKNFTRET